MLTILTPTYNRAYTLTRLYESLLRQDNKDFEWLVIDDGSQDQTEQLIESFIKKNEISIRYYKKENGGKHRAVNYGVPLSKGDFIYILDSDDWLVDNVLGFLLEKCDQIIDDEKFAGFSGVRLDPDGGPMGTGLPYEQLDCSSLELRTKYHVTGEMAEVYKKKILLQYPFPEYEGERFLSEAVVWNRIADKYLIKYFQNGFCYCKYIDDGLTCNIDALYQKNPYGALHLHKSFIDHDPLLKTKLIFSYRYWMYGKNHIKDCPKHLKPYWWMRVLFPLFNVYKKLKNK